MRDFVKIILFITEKTMSNNALLKKLYASQTENELQEFKTGMEVEVSQTIKEWGKERVQKFKGLIIKTAGKTPMEKTITVRRKIGAFGVEKIFAIASPSIQKIEIIRQFKVKRKSIKFIRNLTGKAARLREVWK